MPCGSSEAVITAAMISGNRTLSRQSMRERHQIRVAPGLRWLAPSSPAGAWPLLIGPNAFDPPGGLSEDGAPGSALSLANPDTKQKLEFQPLSR